MKVRYFYLDENDCLHKVAQQRIEAAWWDERPWDDSTRRRLLRIVTVVFDDDFHPRGCFLVRLWLKNGRITREQRREVMAAAQSGMEQLGKRSKTMRHPQIQNQMAGWPATLKGHLAVAVDVPVGQLPPLRFGGPLVVAAQLRMSVKQALGYFAEGAV